MTGARRRACAIVPALVAAGTVAVVGALAGCSSVSSSLDKARASLKQVGAGAHSAPAKTYSVAGVTAVTVNTGGTITVTGTSGSGPVKVTETASYSTTPPTASHTVNGSALTLGYTCKNEILCSVNYDITVPRGTAVHANGGQGTVTLNSLSGPVTARTGTGLINASSLTSPTAVLKSSVSGGVIATFRAVPASVTASAGAGSIVLSVPDSAAYKINADAVVGTSTIGVRRSPASPHAITARTDLGGITINRS